MHTILFKMSLEEHHKLLACMTDGKHRYDIIATVTNTEMDLASSLLCLSDISDIRS